MRQKRRGLETQDFERQTASTLGEAQSASVTAELARILQSEPFQRSPRQRKFLSLIVDRTLRGKADEIKEHTLAVMVFGRHPGSFDAQRDPIVRVEAARIRKKLERYYADAGADSRMHIAIPKGHYRPIFSDPTAEPTGRGTNRQNRFARANEGAIAASNRPRVPTHDSRASDYYYRARYASQQRDAAMYAKAIELFGKAIAVDPNFAQAYASLAGTLLNIAGFVSSPSGPLTADAAAAARRAIALDPTSADAHAALGALAHRVEWNWPDAERLFKRALELDPGSAGSHVSFCFALLTRGRFREATKHLRRARDLDPLNLGMRTGSAQTLYYQRRYVEADAELTALLEIVPKHGFAEFLLALNALYSGRPQAARAAFERASATLPDHPSPHLLIAAALAHEGRLREARDHLSAVLARFDGQYYCRYHLAIARAYLRDRNGLYAALDQAAETRDILLVCLPVEPAFDAYHDDTRFRSFLDEHRLATIEECAAAAGSMPAAIRIGLST
jgi:tetratricopeptide (TPR) repeat protein